MEERTNKIANQIKCSICKSNTLKGNMTFFTCCQTKIQKLVCVKCKDKINCKKCKRKAADKVVKYQDLDKKFLPKLQLKVKRQNKPINNKNRNTTYKNQIQNSSECCICGRNFYKNGIKQYIHKNACGQSYCYPCFYTIFKYQNEMFNQDNIQQKKEYKLVMSCCDQYGQSIDKIQKCFKNDVCVFCGISRDIKALKLQTMVKVCNRLQFCIQCYFNSQQINQEITESINMITGQILDNYSNQCYFCDNFLELKPNMSSMSIKALNSNSCQQCFCRVSYFKFQSPNLLKQYKSVPLSHSGSDLTQICCQCKQKMVKKKGYPVQYQIFQWKDKKKYCNICLYFKFNNIRQIHLTNNKQNSKISRYEQQYECYQTQFRQLCMICGIKIIGMDINYFQLNKKQKDNKQQQNQQINNNIQQLIQYEQYQLECIFCFPCLQALSTYTSKYKKLLDLKQLMVKRDKYFPQLLKNYKQSLINTKLLDNFKKIYVLNGKKKNQKQFARSIIYKQPIRQVENKNQTKNHHFPQFKQQSKPLSQNQQIKNNQFNNLKIKQSQFSNIYSNNEYITRQNQQSKSKPKPDKLRNQKQTQYTLDNNEQQQFHSPSYQPQKQKQIQKNIKKINSPHQSFKKQNKYQYSTQQSYEQFRKSIKSLYTQKGSTYMKTINDTKKLQLKSPYQTDDTNKQQKQKPSPPKIIYPISQKQCRINNCELRGQKVPYDQLMMGIMCKKCWINYLLGQIDLTKRCRDFESFKRKRDNQQKELKEFNEKNQGNGKK